MPNYTATHGINGALYMDLTSGGTAAVGTSTLTRVYGQNTWSADNSRDFVDTTSQALLRFRQGGFITLDTDEPEEQRFFKRRSAAYY